MKKKILIDHRMRKIEKEKLTQLGYEWIPIPKNHVVYSEISSHVDIFCTKINDKIIIEKDLFEKIANQLYNNVSHFTISDQLVRMKYPQDIGYNVCQIGKHAIHNFRYTNQDVLKKIENDNLIKINISQGYSNCSIAVIDENSAIVTDEKIAQTLTLYGVDVLLVKDKKNIKLLNKDGHYSNMSGFIGGCISRIEQYVFVSGDLEKIDDDNKIRDFIISKNLEIIDFKGSDVIDYGGMIIIDT